VLAYSRSDGPALCRRSAASDSGVAIPSGRFQRRFLGRSSAGRQTPHKAAFGPYGTFSGQLILSANTNSALGSQSVACPNYDRGVATAIYVSPSRTITISIEPS
jgi:hypothetical protein